LRGCACWCWLRAAVRRWKDTAHVLKSKGQCRVGGQSRFVPTTIRSAVSSSSGFPSSAGNRLESVSRGRQFRDYRHPRLGTCPCPRCQQGLRQVPGATFPEPGRSSHVAIKPSTSQAWPGRQGRWGHELGLPARQAVTSFTVPRSVSRPTGCEFRRCISDPAPASAARRKTHRKFESLGFCTPCTAISSGGVSPGLILAVQGATAV
jgi:hypothetical protein